MVAKQVLKALGLMPAAVLALGAMSAAAEAPPAAERGAPLLLAQGSFKETPLDDRPAVDRDHGQPPARTSGPPKPPPVPPAPPVARRSAPPPDDASPPAREVPPPPATRTPSRSAGPPARIHEPPPRRDARADPPAYRAAPPRVEDPPARRATVARPARRAPPERSAFYANCTQQCHLSCEAAFEVCNGDASPANPACVKKLESCRTERCSCRIQ